LTSTIDAKLNFIKLNIDDYHLDIYFDILILLLEDDEGGDGIFNLVYFNDMCHL